MRNLPTYRFFHVEQVESVENLSRDRFCIKEKDQQSVLNLSTKAKTNDVESVAKKDLSFYFSTLSTLMKTHSVENLNYKPSLIIKDLEIFPHFPRVPRGKNINQQKNEDLALVLGWMHVVVEEGHIEPAQAAVGRATGWPCRPFKIYSLFVDFDLWCRNQGLLKWEVPPKTLFYSLADELFDREGDTYKFPALDVCKNRFKALRKKHGNS